MNKEEPEAEEEATIEEMNPTLIIETIKIEMKKTSLKKAIEGIMIMVKMIEISRGRSIKGKIDLVIISKGLVIGLSEILDKIKTLMISITMKTRISSLLEETEVNLFRISSSIIIMITREEGEEVEEAISIIESNLKIILRLMKENPKDFITKILIGSNKKIRKEDTTIFHK